MRAGRNAPDSEQSGRDGRRPAPARGGAACEGSAPGQGRQAAPGQWGARRRWSCTSAERSRAVLPSAAPLDPDPRGWQRRPARQPGQRPRRRRLVGGGRRREGRGLGCRLVAGRANARDSDTRRSTTCRFLLGEARAAHTHTRAGRRGRAHAGSPLGIGASWPGRRIQYVTMSPLPLMRTRPRSSRRTVRSGSWARRRSAVRWLHWM